MHNKEALGDWSGIKGTEYHILYALWLLLVQRASKVSFYAGNDLLASPVPPPISSQSINTQDAISIHSVLSDQDVWIQLKSTDQPWTLARILPKSNSDSQQDNLIKNFICNAVLSEEKGGTWQVHLVTQGIVKATEIQDFLANLEEPFVTRLKEEIQKAKAEVQKLHPDVMITDDRLQTIALEILRQLAQTKPKTLEALKSQIETEIALACFDRELTYQIANTLRGALLQDAARGPNAAPTYDQNWLDERAAWPLKSHALFDKNPVLACEAAITHVLPVGWNQDYFVHRELFESAFQQFLNARETVFALVGPSGRGKSWIANDVATRLLEGQVRLLVPGHTLIADATLPSIIAKFVRPYTSVADWTEEQLFRRTLAAARAINSPLVLIIDDLMPPTSGSQTFIKNVVNLINDCHENGIKIVLTCQQQVWELFYFAEAIPADHLFVIERGFSSEKLADLQRAGHSLSLGELTPDEVTAAVKRRLSETADESASFLLRSDQFSVLRNPYFLGRYLDQHAPSLLDGLDIVAPVDVNELLDNRVSEVLRKVASTLSLSEDDLKPAFDSLVSALWANRVEGLPYGVIAQVLKPALADQTSSFLAELRKAGIVTAIGNLKFTEDPLADRLYAKYILTAQDDEIALVTGLRPESDSGVVIALMRGVLSDPIVFAEQLLKEDRRWIRAVSEGLAQSPTTDHRMVAMLAGLLRADPKHWVVSDVGDAFGELASRDERAWKTAAQMYFSFDASERSCGEYILSAAMEFVPERVAAAVRVRLSRAARAPGFFQNEKKRRSRILNGALDPLRGINHRRAAELGQRLISRATAVSLRLDDDEKYSFFEDIDRARGRIALHGKTDELNNLFGELKSNDHLARYRAACALRAIVFDKPHAVKHALCEALLRPDEYALTLNRVLLACYPLISADPALLLDTLKASTLTQWETPTQTAGQVLGLLADLAAQFPNEVCALLPRRLTSFHPEWRAFLSEMHSYAWWRCSEQAPEAKDPLNSLTTPDLTNVPNEFIPFAYRGAAIAQLGSMSAREVSADLLTGNHIFYPLWDLQFAYVNTRQFLERHSDFILAQPAYKQLEHLLLDCVAEEDRVRVHPMNKQLCQSQFRVATLSVEMLTQLGKAAGDPLKCIKQLPRDWQALQMSRELLEDGHAEAEFMDFVKALCEERSHGAKSFQAASERDQCLALLAAREPDPQTALRHYNKDAKGSLFSTSARADGLGRVVDSHPLELLTLLDLSIGDARDISALYFWHTESTSWRGWLLSSVYKRRFELRPIRANEARELCAQILAAIETLPDSAQKREYLTVYQAIRDWLNGNPIIPEFDADESGGLIHQAHAATIDLFRKAAELIKNQDPRWLRLTLNESPGWVESEYEFNEGELSLVAQIYRNYVFPSLRLAFVAIGSHYHLQDPASQTLLERRQGKELIDRFPDIFREAVTCDSVDDYKRARLEKAVTLFEEQRARAPYDEHLVAAYGGLLLRLGCFNDAERTFRDCLDLPGCTANARASVLYDLACVHSRLGNETQCRGFLQQSAALRPLDVKHTNEDPDLAGVRDQAWFKALLQPHSAAATR